jgi:hypothetical protein
LNVTIARRSWSASDGVRSVCRQHGITHKLTKPYHPWTICDAWTKDLTLFNINPHHLIPGPYT